jgi:hypothetical protein
MIHANVFLLLTLLSRSGDSWGGTCSTDSCPYMALCLNFEPKRQYYGSNQVTLRRRREQCQVSQRKSDRVYLHTNTDLSRSYTPKHSETGEPLTSKRFFCQNCGSMLWLHDPTWDEWVGSVVPCGCTVVANRRPLTALS